MLYKVYKQTLTSSLGKGKGSGNKSLQWAPGIETLVPFWKSGIVWAVLRWHRLYWCRGHCNTDAKRILRTQTLCNFVTCIFGLGAMLAGISTIFACLLQREITALATSIPFNSKALLPFLTAQEKHHLSRHSSLLHLKQTKACANCHWSMGD